MRPIQEPGLAPLAEKDRREMLDQHIPYRVQLLEAAVRSIPARNLADNQAFEAGAVSGRILLSFLGVGYAERSGELREDRQHKQKDGMTDDVKAKDVGGRFVELNLLSSEDSRILAQFVQGAHKACAHFTIGSLHQLDVETYTKAVAIIVRLLRECLPQLNW